MPVSTLAASHQPWPTNAACVHQCTIAVRQMSAPATAVVEPARTTVRLRNSSPTVSIDQLPGVPVLPKGCQEVSRVQRTMEGEELPSATVTTTHANVYPFGNLVLRNVAARKTNVSTRKRPNCCTSSRRSIELSKAVNAAVEKRYGTAHWSSYCVFKTPRLQHNNDVIWEEFVVLLTRPGT